MKKLIDDGRGTSAAVLGSGLRYRPRLRPLSGLPLLTPLVDIFFLSLIFFMISSSFVQISGIRVELPRVGTSTTVGLEKFIVTLSQSEGGVKIYFNDKDVDWETLKKEFADVRKISPSATIVIRSDRDVPLEAAAQVMSLAGKAQLDSMIAVMPDRSVCMVLPNRSRIIFCRSEMMISPDGLRV